MKLVPSDLVGLVGIVPTPATPDASDWRTTSSVNFAETEKMMRLVLDAGVDIVMTTGTFGECATLTERELADFVACVAGVVKKTKPLFAGIGTLNTRDTIRRGKELVEVGADGLFVGRPMWLSLDEIGIVRFYRDLAEALPDVPLIVYDNPLAFKAKISGAAYEALASIPEVIGTKHVGGPALLDDARRVGDRCRVLPLVSDWLGAAREDPERFAAAWSGHVACAPTTLVKLARAIARRDWPHAEKLSARCRWAEEAMFAGGDLAQFMNYSIQIGHLRFASAGLIDPGPPRPPYLDHALPESSRAGAIECGRRWASLEADLLTELHGAEETRN